MSDPSKPILVGMALREFPPAKRGEARSFLFWLSNGDHYLIHTEIVRPTKTNYAQAAKRGLAPPGPKVEVTVVPCTPEGSTVLEEGDDRERVPSDVLPFLRDAGVKLAWSPRVT